MGERLRKMTEEEKWEHQLADDILQPSIAIEGLTDVHSQLPDGHTIVSKPVAYEFKYDAKLSYPNIQPAATFTLKISPETVQEFKDYLEGKYGNESNG
jgi:hypothetical protein